jgi:hypothetical protein
MHWQSQWHTRPNFVSTQFRRLADSRLQAYPTIRCFLMPDSRHWLPAVATMAIAIAVGGCAHLNGWTTRQPSLPVRYEIVRGQLVIRSDEPLPPHHRLIDELTAQRTELLTTLNLPPSNEPISVYLFSSPEHFKSFMRAQYPNLPDRRAFFVEKDTALEVYAYWGDRVAEDLRHEVAHGYLHSVVPRIPLWIDEGLAEYFEVPRGMHGLNRAHMALLAERLAQGWQPNVRRLEILSDPAEMDQIDYAESWAWVHLLLHTGPEQRQALCSFLRDIKDAGTGEPLSTRVARLWLNPDETLAAYVSDLTSASAARR